MGIRIIRTGRLSSDAERTFPYLAAPERPALTLSVRVLSGVNRSRDRNDAWLQRQRKSDLRHRRGRCALGRQVWCALIRAGQRTGQKSLNCSTDGRWIARQRPTSDRRNWLPRAEGGEIVDDDGGHGRYIGDFGLRTARRPLRRRPVRQACRLERSAGRVRKPEGLACGRGNISPRCSCSRSCLVVALVAGVFILANRRLKRRLPRAAHGADSSQAWRLPYWRW